jgi:hypothetical protein
MPINTAIQPPMAGHSSTELSQKANFRTKKYQDALSVKINH